MSEGSTRDPVPPEDAAETLDALMRGAGERIAIIDAERRILRSNRAAGARNLDEWVEPQHRAAMRAAVAHTLRTGEPSHYDSVQGEQSDAPQHERTEVLAVSGPASERAIVRTFDVTAEVMARGRLEASDRRYRSLTEHLPDFVVIIDRQRRMHWVNRVGPGLTMEEVVGRPVDAFLSPDTLAGTVAAIEEAFSRGEPKHFVGRTEALADGPHWYLTRVVPMNEQGKFERALLLTAEITDQKRGEFALRASEQRLEQALRAAEIGLWEWTPSRDVVLASPLWAQAAGQADADAEISIERFYASVHTEDLPRVRQTLERAVVPGAEAFEVEYRVRRDADDPGRWLLHRGRFVTLEDPSLEPRVVGTQLDLSARREAEAKRRSLQEQLERAQRLESVGQLAGGVAHDFNNLLLVVLTQTELARRAVQRGKDPGAALAQVQAASERAAELTKKLLAFSRQQGLETRPIAVGALVDRLLTMLRRVIPESITLNHAPLGSDDVAAVDSGQLEQVLLNLCLNARDAMPDGGGIRIETGRMTLDDDDLRDVPALAPGSYVCIRVHDDGPGLSAEVRGRMFEPFFTTKPPGQGTGLGLSVSDGIVKQHGGALRVHSASAGGTVIEILLPPTDDPVEAPARAVREEPETGSETILIAEDEALVRRLVSQILSEAGYRVLEAADGLEAIQIFIKHAEEISLVVLDAVMPQLGGRGAYERIAALSPRVRFLISSGYSDAQMPPAMLARERLAMLHKPYAPGDLLRAVRAALDAPR